MINKNIFKKCVQSLKEAGFVNIVYTMIGIFFALFFSCGLINYLPKLRSRITYWYVLPVFWAYVFIFFIYVIFRKSLQRTEEKKLKCFLFLIALLPRLLLLIHRRFILISDYQAYVNMGTYMLTGQKELTYNIVNNYRIPKYGGLAVFMAIIGKLFSTNLIGYQIANIIMSALICVLVYLIVEDYSKNAAIFASFLMAVYPADIIASQVVTNREGAVLFILLAYILLKRSLKKQSIICLIASGICIAISDFWHPSAIVPVIAFLCFGSMTLFVKNREEERQLVYFKFKSIMIVLISYFIFVNIGLGALKVYGLTDNTQSDFTLAKLVIGFNYETRGTYSADDAAIRSLPKEEQEKVYKQMFRERIIEKSPQDILFLMKDKVATLWFAEDGYFYWYHAVWQQDMKEKFNSGIISEDEYAKVMTELRITGSFSNYDWIYLGMCYLFAIVGVLVRNKENSGLNLVSWLLLGWIMIHLLIEVQSRYRDLAMPYVMIFTAIGAEWCYNKILKNVLKKGHSISA